MMLAPACSLRFAHFCAQSSTAWLMSAVGSAPSPLTPSARAAPSPLTPSAKRMFWQSEPRWFRPCPFSPCFARPLPQRERYGRVGAPFGVFVFGTPRLNCASLPVASFLLFTFFLSSLFSSVRRCWAAAFKRWWTFPSPRTSCAGPSSLPALPPPAATWPSRTPSCACKPPQLPAWRPRSWPTPASSTRSASSCPPRGGRSIRPTSPARSALGSRRVFGTVGAACHSPLTPVALYPPTPSPA